jgi:hypothetical protein
MYKKTNPQQKLALQGLAWAIQDIVVHKDSPIMKHWHIDQDRRSGKESPYGNVLCS